MLTAVSVKKSPVLMITVKPYDNSTGKYGEEYTETLTIGLHRR